MPVTKTAKKALSRSIKQKEFNAPYKVALKKDVKNFRKAAVAGTAEQSELNKVFSSIDKALKKGLIHRNTAANRKSKLAKSLNK
jgi:small subunit ribosomal protein S20